MHAGAGRQSVLPAPFVRTLPGGSGAVVGARPSVPAPTWAAPGQPPPLPWGPDFTCYRRVTWGVWSVWSPGRGGGVDTSHPFQRWVE